MGLISPWAITQSMVKLRLHSPVEASQPPMRACSPLANIKRFAWLVVLTGVLFIAASTLTACVDSAEPTVEVSRGQTPTPGVTPAAIPTIEVPWKRSQFWVSPGNAHPIDIRMNREETLEYTFTVGGDSFGGAIGALVDTAQGFTGPPDIRLKVTGPSGDVLWSAKTASSRNSITAETPGTYTLVFDNSYSQSTGKSISLDHRVLPEGVKAATPLTPPPLMRPTSPSGIELHRDETAIVISWNEVPDAYYYKIYYSDFSSPSCTPHISMPINCELLATQVVETSYRHASPGVYDNYYWVVACNRIECTEIDSENPVAPAYAGPSALPGNVEYRRDGSAIVVSWNAVPDADYYNVYYGDRSSCSLPSITLDTLGIFSALSALSNRRSCEELATDLIETTYTHTSPGDDENYYWVVACNSGGCTDIDTGDPAAFVDTRPSAPGNFEYRRDGSVMVVSWSAATNADYYKIYYDDTFGSSCRLNSSGITVGCEELATNVVDITYTHTSPDADENYYWVVACNRNGCTDIDSENPATFVDTRPSAPPANVQYRRDGTAIVVSWSAAPDADYYKIYYDEFRGSSCRLNSSGITVGCEELAANVVGTAYTHTSPDADENYYWVVACNRNGCTDIDSENPATFVDTRPSAPPANVQYRRDGTAIVVSWSGVPDADYYKIYYTDSAVSICKSIGDTLVVCEELATNVVGTTYTHTSPDDDYNHYWVVACNRNGCTDIDSEIPATFVDTSGSTS